MTSLICFFGQIRMEAVVLGGNLSPFPCLSSLPSHLIPSSHLPHCCTSNILDSMQNLTQVYKGSFWAAPDKFFSDGPVVNLGSDFALMPSLFEPRYVAKLF